jgi:hypothetical protein
MYRVSGVIARLTATGADTTKLTELLQRKRADLRAYKTVAARVEHARRQQGEWELFLRIEQYLAARADAEGQGLAAQIRATVPAWFQDKQSEFQNTQSKFQDTQQEDDDGTEG